MSDGAEFEKRLGEDLHRGFAGGARAPLARWLNAHEMQGGEWDEAGLLLGKRRGRLIGWKDDRHVMTVAGSRQGKGVSLIMPNLMRWQGGALVIDPKGELARVTANRRGKGATADKEGKAGKAGKAGLGQSVHILDPFDTTAEEKTGLQKSSFNPLAALNGTDENTIDDAAMFADALIIPSDKDPHWGESARAVVTALILVVLGEPAHRRNLLTVRRLLQMDDDKLGWNPMPSHKDIPTNQKLYLFLQMLTGESNPIYGHIVRGVGAQLEAMGDKELGSVLSTAITQTQWLDSPRLKSVLGATDLPTFDLSTLKTQATTIYLCLPAGRMGTHSRWLRLMISLALTVMERTRDPRGKDAPPVLFVLDEFPILGRMKAIQDAAGQMAGFGVKLWTIIQNIGQLEEHYGKNGWSTFVGNCGVVTAFGNSDNQTLEELSKRLGRVEIESKHGTGHTTEEQNRGLSRDERRDYPLLNEQEVRLAFAKRGKDNKNEQRVLILTTEHAPAVAQRLEYFSDPIFKGEFDDDPLREVSR